MSSSYPEAIQVSPGAGAGVWSLRVPGSKSLTNRALIVAALAGGESLLKGALDSEDTRVMVESLGRLGFAVDHDPAARSIRVAGRGGLIPNRSASLDLANSGTSLRFLTALTALGRGEYRLDGSARMRERPAADLIMALNRLGGDVVSENGDGCPPLIIRANGLEGGFADVGGATSSQYLSGLLMALPLAKRPTNLEVKGRLVSKPYVDMTLGVMDAFGVRVGNHGHRGYNIEHSWYRAGHYQIEPDASAASYFFAAAAITGGKVTVEGIGTRSLQGDVAFLDVLEFMGCQVERAAESTTVTGGPLRAVDVDMNAISDTVMTLAAVALFAEGVTRIRDVAHIRHKETDRLAALATELRKFGAGVDELPDGLLITPPDRVRAAEVATYNDHRMAMALSLVGLRVEGVNILDPGCVAKTYPTFWDDLAKFARLEPDPSLA